DMWGKKVHKVQVENKTPKGYNYIGWNLRHPIFKDKRVRKAMYHLVNRPLMIEKFEHGVSVPAAGPVYPQSPYLNKSIKPIEYDPKLALKILKDAGWEDTDGDSLLDKMIDGKRTKLSFSILEPWEGFVKYLTIFKEDAKKVGVEITINQLEWNSFMKLVDERKFEAIRMAWSAAVDWDPKQIWHSTSMKSGSNFVGLNIPEMDKLIDEARLIHDRDERIKVLNKVQKMIVDEYPYVWFTYKKPSFYAHTSRIIKTKDTYNYSIGNVFWKIKD
ncbi:ABC transporter substrate-binding protein, partial [Bacteriovoracaceae bacterium]|nr:ABC transporter substrate-binding protein [Bacteriovoracaceae bacterium]